MSDERHIMRVLDEEEIFGKERKQIENEIGLLQMQILWILSRKSTHGYDMMKQLNLIKSTKITQGTLYPSLQKLEKLKLIKREKNDRKVIYHITSEGKMIMRDVCSDFCRTFYGVFQDFVCEKCMDKQ